MKKLLNICRLWTNRVVWQRQWVNMLVCMCFMCSVPFLALKSSNSWSNYTREKSRLASLTLQTPWLSRDWEDRHFKASFYTTLPQPWLFPFALCDASKMDIYISLPPVLAPCLRRRIFTLAGNSTLFWIVMINRERKRVPKCPTAVKASLHKNNSYIVIKNISSKPTLSLVKGRFDAWCSWWWVH